MANIHRILIAVDSSRASRRAVEYVADVIGNSSHFAVGLIHLEVPPRMLEWGGAENAATEARKAEERSEEYSEMEEQYTATGEALLQKFQATFTDRGIEVVDRLLHFDEPLHAKNIAKDVLASATDGDFGTIVVGRRSFSGLKSIFGHHVSEEILTNSEGVTIWVVE